MGYTIEDIMREIKSLKDDDVSREMLSFLQEFGASNGAHTEDARRGRISSGDVVEYAKYLAPMNEAFTKMMDGFSANSSKVISDFGKKYRDSFAEMFDGIVDSIQYDDKGMPLLGTKSGGTAPSKTNSATRTMQSKLHSAQLELTQLLSRSYKVQSHAAKDNSSDAVYTQGSGRRGASGYMNIAQNQRLIETTRKGAGKTAQSFSYQKPSGASKTPTFFDFETVGDLGGKDFGIIEMAAKTATGLKNAFFQLSDEAASAIKANIASVRKAGSKSISADALRSITRMLDYSLNDDNTISALHKDLEGI